MHPEKITVVQHGYNTNFLSLSFPQNRESTIDGSRLRGRDDNGVKYFLYIGRLEKKKNIVGLLHAFAMYRKYGGAQRLILIGKPGFGYDEIKKTIMTLNLIDKIDERGWVAQDEMPVLLINATALILPSLYEGFGLPLLEAFAAGTPMIASSIPALREVGGDAAYYVPPYHPEMFAHALQLMETDERLRVLCIENGQKRIKDFSWSQAAEATYHAFAMH